MLWIIYLFLDVLIGTAVVYDVYFKKIPNYAVAAGVAGIIPIMYGEQAWAGVGFYFLRVLIIGAILYFLYVLGGLGAGDVKLVSVVAAAFSTAEALSFIILMFMCGGVCGLIKLVIRGKITGKARILFTIPIAMAYVLELILKGEAF